jgi:hypothetical protein
MGIATTLYFGLGGMLIHTLLKPQIETVIEIVRLLCILAVSYIIAPFFGAIGVSVVYSVFLVGGAWYKYKYVKKHVYYE